jgi:hypothetical protein
LVRVKYLAQKIIYKINISEILWLFEKIVEKHKMLIYSGFKLLLKAITMLKNVTFVTQKRYI